jgi:hypothetical protein
MILFAILARLRVILSFTSKILISLLVIRVLVLVGSSHWEQSQRVSLSERGQWCSGKVLDVLAQFQHSERAIGEFQMLCLLKVVTQSHQSTLDCHLTRKCVCWRWPFEHVQSLNTPVSYNCNDDPSLIQDLC